MWICTTDGFMSATRRPANTIAAGDDRIMQVRARSASHLTTLRKLMKKADATLSETIKSKNADYQYRAFCTQHDLAVGVAALALNIDYTNFKNTVTNRKLHDAYMRIWSAVLDAFPEGSIYGGRWRAPRGRGGRSAGLATETYVPAQPWYSDGPTVEEEIAMKAHDDGGDPFAFEWTDATPAFPVR